jgi:hypothetical protein
MIELLLALCAYPLAGRRKARARRPLEPLCIELVDALMAGGTKRPFPMSQDQGSLLPCRVR